MCYFPDRADKDVPRSTGLCGVVLGEVARMVGGREPKADL